MLHQAELDLFTIYQEILDGDLCMPYAKLKPRYGNYHILPEMGLHFNIRILSIGLLTG